MFILHPVIQTLSVTLMFYTLYLGIRRFASLHLRRSITFNRKKHIITGKISIISLTAGGAGGFITAHILWGMTFVTGCHGDAALFITAPLAAVFSTGLYLKRNGKNRTSLIVLHGISGLLTIIPALFLAYTGAEILKSIINAV